MTWNTPSLAIVFMLLASAAACVLSWLAVQRSGFAWKSIGFELLRLLCMAIALVTLFQPEFVATTSPPSRSTVAILRDNSNSMLTRDELSDEKVVSRSEAIDKAFDLQSLTSPQVDSKVSENATKFVVQPFSFGDASSKQGTDLSQALKQVSESYPDLRAVLLVSDGDWNVGDSPNAIAQKLRLEKIPVHTASVGKPMRLPDLGIASFDVPSFAINGKPLRIPFAIESSLTEEVDLVVQLIVTGGSPIEQTVRVPTKGMATGTFEFRPKQVGDVELTLKIASDPRDQIADNNMRNVNLAVRAESLKVLLVESYPRWEYRYIRNALERDPGVEVDCYLLHPEIGELGDGRGYLSSFPTEQQLFEYDVVFVGDVGMSSDGGAGQLTQEQCQQIRRLVDSQSGGLVFIPGYRGAQQSLLNGPLADLYPVELDSSNLRGIGSERPGHFQLTEVGRASLLTRLESNETENESLWRSLPGFYWHAGVERARPGTQVLATHDSESSRSGRRPLIVTKTFGNGKVLFMGSDGAWRWRKGVEDKYHYRFWGQVVRWMAYQRTMAAGESMRLIYSPDRPKQDDVVTLQANVIASSGEPLDRGTVTAQIQAPSGATETASLLRSSSESWGLFEGSFRPTESGQYQIVLHCRETEKSLETKLLVQANDREQLGRPARYEVLNEIAAITRGTSGTVSQLAELIAQLKVKPEPTWIEQRTRLWCHPIWGGLLIGLLTAFWVARKYGGML